MGLVRHSFIEYINNSCTFIYNGIELRIAGAGTGGDDSGQGGLPARRRGALGAAL